jgi:YtcA family
MATGADVRAHNPQQRSIRLIVAANASLVLEGCSPQAAPTFNLFGAFFPAWMLCTMIGIFASIAARGIFVATGLQSIVPFQLFVCAAIGLIVAEVVWLFWFG